MMAVAAADAAARVGPADVAAAEVPPYRMAAAAKVERRYSIGMMARPIRTARGPCARYLERVHSNHSMS